LHAGGVVHEFRLLGDCIHALIEERSMDASPREVRILSDWLTARAAAITDAARVAAMLGRLPRVPPLRAQLRRLVSSIEPRQVPLL
jgi:hypothetical protein